MDQPKITNTQAIRLNKAVELTIAQIREAEKIQQSEQSLTIHEDTTLRVAQILAMNYLATVHASKD